MAIARALLPALLSLAVALCLCPAPAHAGAGDLDPAFGAGKGGSRLRSQALLSPGVRAELP